MVVFSLPWIHFVLKTASHSTISPERKDARRLKHIPGRPIYFKTVCLGSKERLKNSTSELGAFAKLLLFRFVSLNSEAAGFLCNEVLVSSQLHGSVPARLPAFSDLGCGSGLSLSLVSSRQSETRAPSSEAATTSPPAPHSTPALTKPVTTQRIVGQRRSHHQVLHRAALGAPLGSVREGLPLLKS